MVNTNLSGERPEVEVIGRKEAVPRRSYSTRRFVRDLFFANLPLPFQKLRTYLWVVFLSRALGPSGFGIWALFQTTLATGVLIASMTQGNAMMRFLGGERKGDEINRTFSSVLAAVSLSTVSLALAIALLSSRLSNLLFRDPRGKPVVLLIAAILPLETWFEMIRGLLRARRLNRSWACLTLSRQVPEMLLLITLVVWWTSDVVSVVAAYLVTAAVSVLAGLVFLARRYQTRFVMPNTTVLRKFIPYGAALVPGALASTLSFSADRYLVGYYLDLRQVGIYSVCFAVSALGFFLVGPLNDVLLPEMAALYDCGDWDGFRKRFSGVQKFVIGAAMLATAILVAFPQQILQLISNREFSSGGPTLTILGLQGLFMSIVMLYVVMLCVRMHVWWTTLVWGGMGVLVLVLDIILLPRIGIVGAAISQLVSSIVGAVVVVGMNCDIFHTTFRFRWLAQSGVALTGVWFVGHLLQGYPVSTVHSIEELAVGSAAFIGGLLATGYLEISDVGRIRDVLSRDFLKERQSSGMLLQRPR